MRSANNDLQEVVEIVRNPGCQVCHRLEALRVDEELLRLLTLGDVFDDGADKSAALPDEWHGGYLYGKYRPILPLVAAGQGLSSLCLGRVAQGGRGFLRFHADLRRGHVEQFPSRVPPELFRCFVEIDEFERVGFRDDNGVLFL